MRVLAPLFALALLAQNPAELFEKAPPHVDEALRARINKFYQAHLEGKFRVADQMVAEDSKDAFFEAPKRRYRAFEIARITYSDNFTRAKAVVVCDDEHMFPGFGVSRVKVPVGSLWKAIDGEWFWYLEPVDTQGGVKTPFGFMRSETPTGALPPPMAKFPNPTDMRSLIKANKTEVQLSRSQPSSDEVVVSNAMPGSISLAVESENLAGLEIKLDRTELKEGETARVSFHWKPPEKTVKSELHVAVRVQPINHVIPIRITLAP